MLIYYLAEWSWCPSGWQRDDAQRGSEMWLRNHKTKFQLACVFGGGIAVLSLLSLLDGKGDNAPEKIISTPDLSIHPIYSQYEFVEDDDVINLGTQPIYFPTGLITEMMMRDGILQDELSKFGKTIRYHHFLKGDDVNYFLKRGDLDVGVGGDMPTVSIAAEHDVRISILMQYGFTSIVAARPMQVSELRRKRIGYAFGSNAHYTLLSALASEGLDESDVILVPMEVSEMPQALASGKIDAFSAWEPTPTIALRGTGDCAIIRKKLSTGYLYFDKSFADNNHEVLRHILASVIRAIRWIRKNEENLLVAFKLNHQREQEFEMHEEILLDAERSELARNDILGLITDPIISDELIKKNGGLHKEFEFLRKLRNKWQALEWEDIQKKFDGQAVVEVLNKSSHYRVDESDYNLAGETVGN